MPQKSVITSWDGPDLAWASHLSSSPSEPGVYWFSDANGQVLYVGKAKNLGNRLRSYKQLPQLSQRILTMVTTATRVEWQVLKSELEALLVEAELIRIHQPQFNILLKDDKSPLYIQITDETFPRVLTQRKKEIISKHLTGTILGPFPSGYKVKEVLQLVRPIFPWCNQASAPQRRTKRACFYYHLDLCPGACVGDISPDEYQASIRQLVLFLRGRQRSILKKLSLQMTKAVESEKFEQAAELRDTIQLIKAVVDHKKKLRPNLTLPSIQFSERKEQLTQLRGLVAQHLPIPRDFELERIEGYDVSNTQGTNPTVAQVTFTHGQPDPAEYRLYNIRSLRTPNDVAMMREALIRRQNHPEWDLPQLVIIDGGKGQLKAALSVWRWTNPIISIAKNPDRILIADLSQLPAGTKITAKTKLQYHIIKLDPDHPALKLVQQVRDEAHRFSKKQHARLQRKSLLSNLK